MLAYIRLYVTNLIGASKRRTAIITAWWCTRNVFTKHSLPFPWRKSLWLQFFIIKGKCGRCMIPPPIIIMENIWDYLKQHSCRLPTLKEKDGQFSVFTRGHIDQTITYPDNPNMYRERHCNWLLNCDQEIGQPAPINRSKIEQHCFYVQSSFFGQPASSCRLCPLRLCVASGLCCPFLKWLLPIGQSWRTHLGWIVVQQWI